ncbi:hypothetical protein L249_5940 [Ophiocordyceps polyrhachis-furcata BCC 54312]|uniref:Uncharacterized protein n=1 Tax=Ophiocordyceps polyrhachis-furcata BCC 54312 TaxID=1330021 RepID=A0A367LIC9_9HYPO|nr:hypothetical protein L249_5940 [Ophiocordyceps polyrhachis-furcata BCC 54312]
MEACRTWASHEMWAINEALHRGMTAGKKLPCYCRHPGFSSLARRSGGLHSAAIEDEEEEEEEEENEPTRAHGQQRGRD